MIFTERFKNKVAVVTGAAQGIGKEVALRMAREGASVMMVDLSTILTDVLEEVKTEKLKLSVITADLETYSGFNEVLKQTKQLYGRIDILVNNVGGTIWAKPYAEYKEAEIEKEVKRSLFPTLWGCHAVLPYLLEQKGGVIVNVSSVATRSVNRVPYAAAKGGVNAITASLAFEYAEQNIRVNAIAPGGTDAPQRIIPRNTAIPTEQEKEWYAQVVEQTKNSSLMKRYGTIDEQVAAIMFLASDEASYITGITIPVAGGDLG